MLQFSHGMQIGYLVFSLIAGIALIFLRMKAAQKPVSLKKIIIPPLAMASGFIMFIIPEMRIPVVWGFSAFCSGLLIFAFPLIVTTRMERKQSNVYVIRSKVFIIIMILLLGIRLSMHGIIEQYMTVPQTGAIFYLLALGMILPWRIAMMNGYLRLQNS
ncbi:cytochrome c biogenesis protein CcdC [Paenibacillaceae bacterium]|nr:cytochrome c biogenesis protein CcdC [Paenibacillaceae bacterium]